MNKFFNNLGLVLMVVGLGFAISLNTDEATITQCISAYGICFLVMGLGWVFVSTTKEVKD